MKGLPSLFSALSFPLCNLQLLRHSHSVGYTCTCIIHTHAPTFTPWLLMYVSHFCMFLTAWYTFVGSVVAPMYMYMYIYVHVFLLVLCVYHNKGTLYPTICKLLQCTNMVTFMYMLRNACTRTSLLMELRVTGGALTPVYSV